GRLGHHGAGEGRPPPSRAPGTGEQSYRENLESVQARRCARGPKPNRPRDRRQLLGTGGLLPLAGGLVSSTYDQRLEARIVVPLSGRLATAEVKLGVYGGRSYSEEVQGGEEDG